MDWDLLRCFLAVAQEGTLSAAATRLRISQPTVGRRVAELERSVGRSLFVKSGKGYRLTPAGEHLVPKAGAIERLIFDWNDESADDDLAGPVRLSAGEWLSHLVAREASALLADLPKLELHISVSQKLSDLDDGTVDIALRNKVPEILHLVSRRIGSMHHAVYGAAKLVREHNLSVSNYAEFPHWVILSDGVGVQRSAAWVRRLTGRDRAGVSCSSSRAVLDAVISGAGLALLPCFVGDQAPGLVKVAMPGESWDIVMVLHPDRHKVRRVREVGSRVAKLVRTSLRAT